MSFIMKKKRFKFQVNFSLEELSSVPFVNGVLFGKVRLLDGGSFSDSSTREEVCNHCVQWNTRFNFLCKMNANASTGILDPCLCRVSIRKEVKGGKSYVKLGFVDLNLAEYAGASNKSRRYLLEGYDSKHRQDNSILKVTIGMTLVSGDPLFKAPDVRELAMPGELAQDERFYLLSYKHSDEFVKGGSVASHGGTVGKSKARPSVLSSSLVTPEHEGAVGADETFAKGHSRSSSYNSQHSRTGSTHSRSSSNNTEPFSSGNSLNETTSESCRNSWTNSAERRRKEESQKKRVDDTRVDADEVIDTLIKQQDFTAESKSGDEGDQGLQLFIAKDGSTALGSQQIKQRMTAGVFEKVVIDKR
ncbi:early estrogen-induced gene 1 protein-like [Ptychodera flava]|uniref:early estrogen-induced gene 1 protein-like n=1 Tax=Ptychodera flava TaxID=63121 RepID=UPI003969C6E2